MHKATSPLDYAFRQRASALPEGAASLPLPLPPPPPLPQQQAANSSAPAGELAGAAPAAAATLPDLTADLPELPGVEALATELRIATAALVHTGAAYSLPGDDEEGDSTSSVIESAEDSASAEELVLALAEFTAADLESGFPDLVDGELPLAALEVLQDYDLSSDSSKAVFGSSAAQPTQQPVATDIAPAAPAECVDPDAFLNSILA